MRTHFHNEMADLQQEVIALGDDVRRNVTESVESLRGMDRARAERVMRNDHEIDLREVRNEEACLKIIALHQPVADDLRYLVVLNKVNHELERVSDLAVEIAKCASNSCDSTAAADWGARLADLTAEVAGRLQQVLQALVNKDAEAARGIWLGDAEINLRSREIAGQLRETIVSAGRSGMEMFPLLEGAGHIERLADHVKNIAKDIIYLVLGEIVRHRSGEFKQGMITSEPSGCP